jgi:hypothetical protein
MSGDPEVKRAPFRWLGAIDSAFDLTRPGNANEGDGLGSASFAWPQGRRTTFLTQVRPAKAGLFSGRQSHRDKSQSPVAWIASAEETKLMKPIDKAILGMVSESPGRNVSEPRGGLDKINSGGRAHYGRAKAA